MFKKRGHPFSSSFVQYCNISKIKREIKMMSLLDLHNDECDNLNFINFKMDSFKIRYKIVNFRNF